MSDPITAAAGGVSILGSVIGGGISSAGAAAKGQAGYVTNMFQAMIAQRNAQIADQNSAYTLDQGENQAQKYGLSAANKMGNIINAQGASGLDVNSGTNKSVQQGQQTISDMDLAQIRANAAKTAFDYRNQADSYRTSSIMYMAGANNAQAAASIDESSSFISTATSVASKWTQGKQVGMWS